MIMKKYILLTLALIVILMLSNIGLACMSIPNAVIFDDQDCIKSDWDVSGGGRVVYYPSSFYMNKTEIISELQKYKNYSYKCYVPGNEQGDEEYCRYCGIGPNKTCSDFEQWIVENNNSFYKNWTCGDDCTICHWRYSRIVNLTDIDIEIITEFITNGYSVIRHTDAEYNEFLENAISVNEDKNTCDYYSAVAHRNGWTGYAFGINANKTLGCLDQQIRTSCGAVKVNILWNELPESKMNVTEEITPGEYLERMPGGSGCSGMCRTAVFVIVALVLILFFYKRYLKD